MTDLYEFPVIFRTIVGSRAYGLATPDSDTDYREVFIVPTSLMVGLTNPPKQGWQSGHRATDDEGGWELAKWLRMVEEGSPNATELIWAPREELECPAYVSPSKVTAMAVALLTAPEVARATLGYANNSFRKIKDNEQKWLTGYLRSIVMGYELLRTGRMSFPVEQLDMLQRVRAGLMSAGTVLDQGAIIERRIRSLGAGGGPLPQKVSDLDRELVDRNLSRIRRANWS